MKIPSTMLILAALQATGDTEAALPLPRPRPEPLPPTQADLEKLEAARQKRMRRALKRGHT